MKGAILLSSLYILTMQHVHGLHYPQYFQAFNLSSCIGPSSDFLGTTTNMSLLPGLTSANSLSGRGMWRAEFGDAASVTWTDNAHNGKSCILLTDPDLPPLTEAIQLVEGDLDDSVLSMFTEETFRGRQRIVASDITTFGETFIVKSYAFTGAKGFTLYAGYNFTGNSTCLEPNSLIKTKGWGVNSVFYSDITARSATIGCDAGSSKVITGSSETKNYAFNSKTGEKLEGIIKNVDGVIEY